MHSAFGCMPCINIELLAFNSISCVILSAALPVCSFGCDIDLFAIMHPVLRNVPTN